LRNGDIGEKKKYKIKIMAVQVHKCKLCSAYCKLRSLYCIPCSDVVRMLRQKEYNKAKYERKICQK
jgi:hypothetical protein